MSLDREVKYLLNKMKFAKPKLKKEEKTKGTAAASNETIRETVEELRTPEEKSNEASVDAQPFQDIAGVKKNEELKDGEQKGSAPHDSSEL